MMTFGCFYCLYHLCQNSYLSNVRNFIVMYLEVLKPLKIGVFENINFWLFLKKPTESEFLFKIIRNYQSTQAPLDGITFFPHSQIAERQKIFQLNLNGRDWPI